MSRPIPPEHQAIIDYYAPGQSGSMYDYDEAARIGKAACAEGHREPRYDNGEYLFCTRCGLREWPDGFTSYGMRPRPGAQ